MKISQILKENEKEFDNLFVYPDFYFDEVMEIKLRRPWRPIFQLPDREITAIKSFFHSSQTTLIKGMIEEVEGMKKKSSKEFLKAKDMKSAHDFFNGEQYALQKVIDYLKEGIKV